VINKKEGGQRKKREKKEKGEGNRKECNKYLLNHPFFYLGVGSLQ
jgi:hypothetical protein